MTATLNSDDFIFETNGPPPAPLGYTISGSTVHLHGTLWNGPVDGNGHPMPIQPSVFHQSPPWKVPVPSGFPPIAPFVPAKTPEEMAADAEQMTRKPDHEFAGNDEHPDWCDECPWNNIYRNDAAAHIYVIPEWW